MMDQCLRSLKPNYALRPADASTSNPKTLAPCRRLDKLFESGLDDVLRSKGLLLADEMNPERFFFWRGVQGLGFKV